MVRLGFDGHVLLSTPWGWLGCTSPLIFNHLTTRIWRDTGGNGGIIEILRSKDFQGGLGHGVAVLECANISVEFDLLHAGCWG
jgi:hypothetical protein